MIYVNLKNNELANILLSHYPTKAIIEVDYNPIRCGRVLRIIDILRKREDSNLVALCKYSRIRSGQMKPDIDLNITTLECTEEQLRGII